MNASSNKLYYGFFEMLIHQFRQRLGPHHKNKPAHLAEWAKTGQAAWHGTSCKFSKAVDRDVIHQLVLCLWQKTNF